MTFGKLLNWMNSYSYRFEDALGRTWAIPLRLIVLDHSNYYSERDEIDSAESMENTMQLFHDDISEIEDWARNNMDWDGVKKQAVLILDKNINMQESWLNPKLSWLGETVE